MMISRLETLKHQTAKSLLFDSNTRSILSSLDMAVDVVSVKDRVVVPITLATNNSLA